MNRLHTRQLALRQALTEVSMSPTSDHAIPSSRGSMVDRVMAAVGVSGASVAEVYGELVDLAVILELARACAPVNMATIAVVEGFIADCIEIVVEELRSSNA